jgi:hypothetical protein
VVVYINTTQTAFTFQPIHEVINERSGPKGAVTVLLKDFWEKLEQEADEYYLQYITVKPIQLTVALPRTRRWAAAANNLIHYYLRN